MSDIPRAAAIRGTTMRWAWTDGPTKGMVHEHIFHDDGRPAPPERVPYAAFEVTPEVYAVSYLAGSGFTLTVVLNVATGQLVGFASGSQAWYPLRGTCERVR